MTLSLANGRFSYNSAEWDDIPVKPFLNQPLPYDPNHPQEVGNDARIVGGNINSVHLKGLIIPAFRYFVWNGWPIEFFQYMQRCDIIHERNWWESIRMVDNREWECFRRWMWFRVDPRLMRILKMQEKTGLLKGKV